MTEEKLKKKMLKTFEYLKKAHLTKQKRTQNLYFDSINQTALCIKTSKSYTHQFAQKYWYTLTPPDKIFLEGAKKSYVFLGCLDNSNTAYLIPFHKYKKNFLNCNITRTGWHVRINHELHWCFSKEPDISLSQFAQPLCVCSINKEIKKN